MKNLANHSSRIQRFCILSVLILTALLSQPATHAAKILYIVNSFSDPSTPALGNDQEVFDRLTSQGHKVTLADDDTVSVADTTGMELVLISSSVGSGAAGVNPLSINTLRMGRIPVISYEPGLYDELMFQRENTFGNANGHTSLAISAANKGHPLAAGKSGTVDIVAPGDGAVVSSSALPYTVGTNAIIIATNATPDVDVGHISMWAYDTGSRLADNTTVVPSRRVALFFNATTAPGSYNDVAYALFDAAVKWALESAPKGLSPTASITAPTAGATFAAGAAITINATAADADGTVTKVEFFAGTNKIGEDTTSPYSIIWNNVASGRYLLTAKATDNTGNIGASAEVKIVVGTPPLEVAFVIGALPPNASEAALIQRLVKTGLVVTPIDDDAAVPSDINDRALILVASTSGSGNITKYRDVPVPIINWEWAAYDGLGMAEADGGTIDNSETQIDIVDATHPLAAGLPKGLRTIFPAAAAQMAAGEPVPSAKIVAVAADGSGRAVLFGFEKGALLSEAVVPGLKAPARRVGIFLGGDTFSGLNADGLKIFDAAVNWAMNRSATQPPGKFNSPTIQGKAIVVSWAGAGRLQQADAVAGPWSDAPVQTNPQTVGIAGAMKFYRLQQ